MCCVNFSNKKINKTSLARVKLFKRSNKYLFLLRPKRSCFCLVSVIPLLLYFFINTHHFSFRRTPFIPRYVIVFFSHGLPFFFPHLFLLVSNWQQHRRGFLFEKGIQLHVQLSNLALDRRNIFVMSSRSTLVTKVWECVSYRWQLTWQRFNNQRLYMFRMCLLQRDFILYLKYFLSISLFRLFCIIILYYYLTRCFFISWIIQVSVLNFIVLINTLSLCFLIFLVLSGL